MSQDEQRFKDLARSFWEHFNLKEWDKAKALLSHDFVAHWPQSKEKIVGRDNFIEINRIYPGTHKIKVLSDNCEYKTNEYRAIVTTQTYIETDSPDGTKMKLFAISFFEIKDNENLKINSIKEYWADCYEAPEWRKHLVEVESEKLF